MRMTPEFDLAISQLARAAIRGAFPHDANLFVTPAQIGQAVLDECGIALDEGTVKWWLCTATVDEPRRWH